MPIATRIGGAAVTTALASRSTNGIVTGRTSSSRGTDAAVADARGGAAAVDELGAMKSRAL